MKSCPYCNSSVEDSWSYCRHCNKPLITHVKSTPIRQSPKHFTESVSMQSLQAEEEELYDFNIIIDEEIECKIQELDKLLNKKQTAGEPIGQILFQKASLYYRKRDFSTALRIIDSAVNYFKEESDTLNLGIAYNEIGLLQEDMGFFDNSIYSFERAIESFKEINDNQKLIQVYNNLANIYYLIKELEHSYEYYKSALKLAERENLTSEEIKTSSNLVEVLFLLNEYDRIEKILKRNLEYFERIGDTYGIIISLIKIGKLSYHLGANSHKRALENLIGALEMINKLSTGKYISIFTKAQMEWECLLYLGKYYLDYQYYNKAENYLLKSLEAIRIFEVGESVKEGIILEELANLYRNKAEFQKSIDYYDLSIEIYYKFGDDYKKAELKAKVGKIYFEDLGNTSEAISSLEEALDNFEELNYIKESAEVLHKLGDIYIQDGAIASAISNFKRAKEYYEILQDEYNNSLVTEKINSLNNSETDFY